MKIGIISELNLKNVNYGNRLQAFALNYFLNENNKNTAESILLKYYDEKRDTSNKLTGKIKSKLYKYKSIILRKKLSAYFKKRLDNCNKFTINNIKLSKRKHTLKSLKNSDYDTLIVGSDVVWAQFNNGINKIRFLDIKKDGLNKISYAASFGRDWIPDENKKIIKENLSSFSNISVREKSSIKLLNSIEVKNVNHVCDPTLLLSKEEWRKFEEKPTNIKNNFIFVYLLGKDKKQREEIKRVAKENNLIIVNVPHANGIESNVDINFADINIDDCSPENWLWLIDKCEYLFTDSFHGTIFATIFTKKFLILKREDHININNRMIDYLNTIEEKDKFVNLNDIKDITKLNWDYKKINAKINMFKNSSIKYIDEALNK